MPERARDWISFLFSRESLVEVGGKEGCELISRYIVSCHFYTTQHVLTVTGFFFYPLLPSEHAHWVIQAHLQTHFILKSNLQLEASCHNNSKVSVWTEPWPIKTPLNKQAKPAFPRCYELWDREREREINASCDLNQRDMSHNQSIYVGTVSQSLSLTLAVGWPNENSGQPHRDEDAGGTL